MTLFFRTLNKRKRSLIILCLFGIALVLLYVSIYPSIQKEADTFTKVIQSMKGSFLKAFGLEDFSIISLEGLMSAQFFTIIWPLVVIMTNISYGGSMIAGEIEQGTMGSLISLPISRLRIFISKYLVGVLSLFLFVATSILSAIPLATLFNITFNPDHFIISAILGFIFGMTILSIAVFFSSIFSEKGKVYSTFGGILVLMYLIKIISNLYQPLENLKYLSLFYYFNSTEAMVHGNIDNLTFIVFGTITFISTLIAAYWFTKRDIVI